MRLVYFFYYLKKLDKDKFSTFLEFTKKQTGKNNISIVFEMIKDSLKYNISILEYFQFRFFEKTHSEKKEWAGTGFMYEFQLKMNPKEARDILDDKRLFNKNYKNYFIHQVASIQDLELDSQLFNILKNTVAKKIVFKVSDGKCGVGVKIESTDLFSSNEELINYMKNNSFDLVEEFIIQHKDLNQLSPSAVNTVRIFTQLNSKGDVEILGCRQRISINNSIDNMAAGNIAASINEDTGLIEGLGVYSDITKKSEEYHPVTNVKIPGYQIPFWNECVELVKKAAKEHPQNKSIGWDIVVTENGPGLIEGNHDWCKLVWQLPVNKGLKDKLLKHV